MVLLRQHGRLNIKRKSKVLIKCGRGMNDATIARFERELVVLMVIAVAVVVVTVVFFYEINKRNIFVCLPVIDVMV